MARRISDDFINDLLHGELSELLEYVKSDDTLDLEFRKKKIIIYYRGGKLLEVKEKRPNIYEFVSGDKGYNPKMKDFNKPSIAELDQYIPQFKNIIDLYFGGSRLDKKERVRFSFENEIRQHIVRENNFANKADQTDYFIIDVEYETELRKKFDIVAIEWEANPTYRKLQKKYTPKIVIFELKYAEASIQSKCGLEDHLKDFESFKKNVDEVNKFKSDMLDVLKHKRELGLIPYLNKTNKNVVTKFAEEVSFVNIIANFKKESSTLKKEVDKMDKFDMIIANFMGYGLYKHCIRSKDEVLKLIEIDKLNS